MFYLFILESIGTSELILIALVALIVFGPRKLPELARTLGKAMNEFRRSTDDFKKTWQQEVEFENGEVNNQSELTALSENSTTVDNSIQRNSISTKPEIIAPKVKEMSQIEFQGNLPKRETPVKKTPQPELTNKHDWL